MDSVQTAVQTLDYSQRFPQIEIESEHETITLKDTSFEDSMTRLQSVLNEMAESRFYKNIKVHFGAKTKEKINYIEQHYERQLDNLNKLLFEEKDRLKNIVQAQNEERLQHAELTHRLNLVVLRKRYEEVRHSSYYPCIFVHAEKKGPLFGNIQQDINRHGAGTLSAKIGYRSPFLRYDTMMLNLEWPVQTKINKRYYQFGVTWNNSIKKLGDLSLKYSLGNQPTYDNVDTHSNIFSLGVQQEKKRYEFQFGRRVPFLHKHMMSEIQSGFFHPSNKCSFKFTNILENTLKQNQVTEGAFCQFKSQLGLPFLSQAQFLRLQFSHRHFYDTYPLRKYFENDLAKKLFWKSTIQTNFNATTIAQYGRRHYINEILEPIDLRGFQSYKRPTPSYANFKASVKFNIHNYPLLHEANVVGFMYGQLGLCFLKKQRFLNPYLLGSSGLGVAVNLGLAQLELLCNLMQYQNKRLREPCAFQFRFSMND